jgi:hypothetical protein
LGRQHQKERKTLTLALNTAAIALAARAHGPDTASRIIRKLRVSENKFYADIFETERNYVQTLRFRD